MNIKKYFYLISFTCFISFIYLSLSYTASFFLFKKNNISKISSTILKAKTNVMFDNRLSFKQELQKLFPEEKIGVFDTSCKPLFISDLSLNSETCTKKLNTYYWKHVNSDHKEYILSLNKNLFVSLFLEEYFQYIIVSSFIFFVVMLILIFFTFSTLIESPIKAISQEIKNVLNGDSPQLLNQKRNNNFIINNLYNSIIQLLNVLTKFEKEKAIFSLSRQVSHDIRSPLEVLRHISKDLNTLDIKTKTALIASIDRISKIATDLLDGTNTHNKSIINIASFLKEIIHEKELELKKEIKFLNPKGLDSICSKINDNLLYRSLSNIINNAFEAYEGQDGEVIISLESDLDNILIEIKDFGVGISDENITKILSGNFTTKEKGNGIGLTSSLALISALDGELSIDSVFGEGTTIAIRLPKFKKPKIILIDDDQLIHYMWQREAKTQNIDLTTFFTVDDFIANKEQFPKDTYIYIDSNLGNDLKGEVEAHKIKEAGFDEIYLATAYPEGSINLPSWIKGVIGKRPPFTQA